MGTGDNKEAMDTSELEPLMGKSKPASSWLPSRSGISLALWFAGVQLGLGAIRSGFASYHMNMYLTVYGMAAATVARVHSMFAVWNPINDLIGAWLSDTWAATHSGSRTNYIWPQFLLWPICCVVPFMPTIVSYTGPTAMLLGALCVEDTFFSFVLIALGGMWTDITFGEAERVKITRLEKVLALLSLPLVSMNYRHWTSAEQADNPGMFATYYLHVAGVGTIVCLLCMWKLSSLEDVGLRRRGNTSHNERRLALGDFVSSLPKQTNLWCFVVMNVLNEVQSGFNGEFAAIFADINLRDTMTVEARSTYLTLESASVIVVSLIFTFVAQAHGVYCVYLYTLWAKFLAGVVLLPLSPNGFVAAAYNWLSVVCTGSAMGFFVVAVGNLVDEYRYNRMLSGMPCGASVVGLFWGLHALISKPLDSVGPVIGSYVLEAAGWTGEAMKGPVTDAAKLAGYRLVIGFPVVCGIFQLIAWHIFDLHGAKLERIQREIG